ncbi:MAG: glutamate 5-kinase [Rickettsiales bacterium]|nr:glutamate 5-kinase [Rickettsiales bacterium]
MSQTIKNAQRIVIKIGSALIADSQNGDIKTDWIEQLAYDVHQLVKEGKEIAIVSSGSIAVGRKFINVNNDNFKLEHKQAAASCGQLEIMNTYQSCFLQYDLQTSQILITIDDTEDRRRYLNSRLTINALIDSGIIPIINENDTVATPEIRFGDNDRLAARVAQMIEADVLIILSDIDGLYSKNPHEHKDAKHIAVVESISDDIRAMAGDSSSNVGTGGMITKLAAAEIAISAGCHTIISRGEVARPILSLMEPDTRYTCFVADSNPISARKNWLSMHLRHLGEITIDEGAVKALKQGNSLLPVGVTKIDGVFNRGDAVNIVNQANDVIAKGLSTFSSDEAYKIMGVNTSEVESILGYQGRTEMIHRNEMVILSSESWDQATKGKAPGV